MQPKFKDAVSSLYPTANWIIRGNSYEGLEWFDETQTKPSEEEIEQELERLLQEHPKKIAQASRATAYSQEADPIAFKMLRGEATKEEWEAKIEEIRQRYPYPS